MCHATIYQLYLDSDISCAYAVFEDKVMGKLKAFDRSRLGEL
jgi:hypothetical protein